MWFMLAAGSAFLYAFRGVLEKLLVARVDRYILGLAIRLFALPFFYLPFIFRPDLFIPFHELPLNFWLAIAGVVGVCAPLETYFYYKAIKDEEISLALPILSLAPVFTIGLAAVVLNESPTILGVIGVLAILFGVYALKIDQARHGLLEPFYHLGRNKSVQLMVVVAVSLAVSATLDKVGVSAANAYMWAVVDYTILCPILAIFVFARAKPHVRQLRTHAKDFLLLGAVVASYSLLYYVAIGMGNVAYVVAIRSASLLITILLGFLWLKEKDFQTKIFAGGVIVAGLIFVKILG